jgi:hypothetical protein
MPASRVRAPSAAAAAGSPGGRWMSPPHSIAAMPFAAASAMTSAGVRRRKVTEHSAGRIVMR